jgi:hypothetical protein
MDEAYRVQKKWVIVVDPEGKAEEMLQDLKGPVLTYECAPDMDAENLR